MLHRTIKRFGIEGEAGDDSLLPRVRAHYERLVIEQMRVLGYVPVLGLGPYFATAWVPEKDTYKFVVSVHGIYVGRKKACQVEGVTLDERVITLPSKLKPSSKPSE